MATFHELSTGQLRQALQLREQIETLQKQLNSLLGGSGSAPSKTTIPAIRRKGKRTMSPEGRARIGAAAKARWAKLRTKAAPAKAAPAKTAAKASPKKRELTPEGRAKLAAAMKARWADRKKNAQATVSSDK